MDLNEEEKKISLSMKALEAEYTSEVEAAEYVSEETEDTEE